VAKQAPKKTAPQGGRHDDALGAGSLQADISLS
jgi:hypothetical protein